MAAPAHRGFCDHDCLGGDCEEGRCQPIALSSPLSVAEYRALRVEDGPNGEIYLARWRVQTTPAGIIYRLSKSGPGVASFVEALPDWGWANDLQIDADYVDYTNYSDHDSLPVRGVYRRPRAGGEPEQLVADTPEESYTGTAFIRLDGDEVIFNTWYGDVGIGAVSRDGGEVSTLASFSGPNPHYDMAGEIQIDDEWVYTGQQPRGIVRYPRDGGGEPELLYEEDAGRPLLHVAAFDGTYIYWLDADAVLRRGPKDGSGPIEVVTASTNRDVQLEGGYVYTTGVNGRSIVRKSLADLSSELEVVVQLDDDDDAVASIAFDEVSLYWLGLGKGQVHRLRL